MINFKTFTATESPPYWDVTLALAYTSLFLADEHSTVPLGFETLLSGPQYTRALLWIKVIILNVFEVICKVFQVIKPFYHILGRCKDQGITYIIISLANLNFSFVFFNWFIVQSMYLTDENKHIYNNLK